MSRVHFGLTAASERLQMRFPFLLQKCIRLILENWITPIYEEVGEGAIDLTMLENVIL